MDMITGTRYWVSFEFNDGFGLESVHREFDSPEAAAEFARMAVKEGCESVGAFFINEIADGVVAF